MNISTKSTGFSLVPFSLAELMVVVTIMSILVAAFVPNMVRHAERTRRTVDVCAAEEIARALQIIGVGYGNLSYDADELVAYSADDDVNAILWRKEDVLESGMTEEEFIESKSGLTESGEYKLDGMLFSHLGEIPVSATNPDYMWQVTYDSHTGDVLNIHFVETNEAGTDITQKIEIYPDSEAFLAMK